MKKNKETKPEETREETREEETKEKEPKYSYRKIARKTVQLPSLNVTPAMREETEQAVEKLGISLSDYLRMAIEEMNKKTLNKEDLR